MHRLIQARGRVLPNTTRSVSTASKDHGKRLDGRVAIVTASTNGMGFAIAQRFAEEGAHVVVSSRRQENVDQATKKLQDMGLKASGFACHVGKSVERKRMFEYTEKNLGGIDILVQHAGVNPYIGEILDTPESAVDKLLDLHVKSNILIIQEVVPYMAKRKQNNPAILLTSSSAAHRGERYPCVYAVSKSSIFSMVRAFMPSLNERNIRINCLSAGAFSTDFMANVEKYKDTKDVFLKEIPMSRFGRPEECAGMAALLCSDDASYITGETISVNGGVFTGL